MSNTNIEQGISNIECRSGIPKCLNPGFAIPHALLFFVFLLRFSVFDIPYSIFAFSPGRVGQAQIFIFLPNFDQKPAA